MAKRVSNSGRTTASKRRKERKPFVPAGTITNPDILGQPVGVPAPPEPTAITRTYTREADRFTTSRPVNDRLARLARPRPGVALPTIDNYDYVARDLRLIGVITAALILGMIGLTFVIP